MTSEQIQPKPTPWFFVKNLGKLLKLKTSNRRKIEKFVHSNKKLNQPLYPKTEGTRGPMEEGMIYVLFNSDGLEDIEKINTAFRFFWVDAPSLRFAAFDSYIVSETFTSKHWGISYPRGFLLNSGKTRYHQEIREDKADFCIDGTWEEGYNFDFHDKQLDMKAKLRYTPLDSKGILFYYNGRETVCPSMTQTFYDSFGFKVTGEFEVEGKRIEITNGRGIIEHGMGIFSSYNVYDWRWLNLQFANGAIHLFYHSLDLEREGILEIGEGALVMDGEWNHFMTGDFKIEEISYIEDTNLPSKVPIEWKITGGFKEADNPLLEMKVSATTKHSWIGNMGKENEFITNYVLIAIGTWKGKEIQGKGTMENIMHRIIE